jgi:hypothetical protein
VATPSEAHASERALRPGVGAPSRVALAVAHARKGKRRKIEIAPRLRLVANGDAWPLWTTRVGPAAQGAAEVTVLSAGFDDQAQSRPEASSDPSKAESTAQPTYRGPPRPRARRSAVPPVPVVCDNFGPRLPIGRAELDVIETYLERERRELLGHAKQAGNSERA